MPIRQNGEGKGLGKVLESVVGRRERMKRDSGIKDSYDRSRGVEILIPDPFTKIKPTDPFRLSKQETRRNGN